MGNHQHRVLAFKALDRLLHQPFALGIQGTGGPIEDQQFGLPQNRPRQAQPLPWPPLSRWPRSPTNVPYPCGRLSMKPAAWAAWQTAVI